MELVDFLQNPEKYKKYGAKIPQGTILYGPPGTGKTLLAKALAGETKSNFIFAAGSDFVEKYVGVGAARVRNMFAEARKKSPCIIFIDEIDAVGSSRNSVENNDEKKHTLNQFLSEMDGFKDNTGVIVIAATNRFEDLDAAFIRSGRFDRQICVDLPDISARYEILKVHSKNKPLRRDVNLTEIAKQTTFMSGADLENVLNEAAIYCAKEEAEAITFEHISRAINKVLVGDEKKNRENYKQRDKEITAYHEAGHAIVSRMIAKDDVPKVSIIPTTKGAGGYTLTLPEENLYSTKKQFRQRISVLLAGRAAEEIIFGEENITGGAANDIERATSLSLQILTSLGMNEQIGLVNTSYISRYSGNISEIIFKEVKLYLDEIYKETKDALNANKEKLMAVASLLLDKETIYKEDLDSVIC
jgi:cell division protease FtsH